MSEPGLRALTLRQPWASLIAVGGLQYATQPAPAPADSVDKPLAIYASTAAVPAAVPEPMERALAKVELKAEELPTAAFVAVVTMHDSFPAEEVARGLVAKHAPNMPDELHLGNFEPGMWAWRFAARRNLLEPVGYRRPPEHTEALWEVPTPILDRLRAAYVAGREVAHA